MSLVGNSTTHDLLANLTLLALTSPHSSKSRIVLSWVRLSPNIMFLTYVQNMMRHRQTMSSGSYLCSGTDAFEGCKIPSESGSA